MSESREMGPHLALGSFLFGFAGASSFFTSSTFFASPLSSFPPVASPSESSDESLPYPAMRSPSIQPRLVPLLSSFVQRGLLQRLILEAFLWGLSTRPVLRVLVGVLSGQRSSLCALSFPIAEDINL